MAKLKEGVFISFEGADASGKTTNTLFFIEELKKRGYEVVHTREPGGSPTGEKIRALVLSERMDKDSEALLFAASRRCNIMQTILPNVAEGKVVVCERYSDSSYAYQGIGRDNRERILELEKWTVQDYQPKYTLFLNITEEESERRLAMRRTTTELDIFELEAQKFRQAVYRGYQERVAQFPERIVKIDAMGPLNEVQANLVTWIDTVFVPNHPFAEEK